MKKICIMLILFLIMLCGCGSENINNDDSNTTSDYSSKQDNSQEMIQNALETFKTSCNGNYKDISYSLLSRNPDNYRGECVHFKGQVAQVMEDFDIKLAILRVYTKKTDYDYIDNYYNDDVIYVYVYNYDKNNRILENDIINLNGASTGLETYETVLGASVTIPAMVAIDYSIVQE